MFSSLAVRDPGRYIGAKIAAPTVPAFPYMWRGLKRTDCSIVFLGRIHEPLLSHEGGVRGPSK